MKKEGQYKTFHIRIPISLASKVENLAEETYKTEAQVFRDALTLFFSNNGNLQPIQNNI